MKRCAAWDAMQGKTSFACYVERNRWRVQTLRCCARRPLARLKRVCEAAEREVSAAFASECDVSAKASDASSMISSTLAILYKLVIALPPNSKTSPSTSRRSVWPVDQLVGGGFLYSVSAAPKQTMASDRSCLGLSDTCPSCVTDARMAHPSGQVLDKPQGRKPRGMPQWLD
jgi:hypothetical protein